MDLSDIDLCDLAQFESGCPDPVFALLRREAPVWFHPVTANVPDAEGFWVISRNQDARDVLKNFIDFSSETGGGAREGGGTILPDLALAEKDIRLAIESADALGTPVPLARAAHGTLEQAMAMGLGENFFLATMEALEQQAQFTAPEVDPDQA